MLIGSILINGVELVTQTLLRGFQLTDDISTRISEATMVIIGDAAILDSILAPNATITIATGLELTGPLLGEGLYGEDVFGGVLSGDVIFTGNIAKLATKVFKPKNLVTGETDPGFTEYTVSCRDLGALMDSAIISTPIQYTDQDDQSIILDIFGTYLPAIDTSEVASVVVLSSITFQNVSLRNAMEQICDLTGCEFSIVPGTNKLKYYSPDGTPAPFGLSDTPDNSTTFKPILATVTYNKEFTTGANRVSVVWADDTEVVDDAPSQAQYGLLSTVVVDRNIHSAGEAAARGSVELARRAQPTKNGSFTILREGLAPGQLITIDMPESGISGSFLLRKVSKTWQSRYVTYYQVDFGDWKPDIVKTLRKLQVLSAQPTWTPPSGTPDPGSVTATSFASSIEPILVVTSLPALPDTSISDNAVVLLTTDRKLYRRNVNTWTALVSTTDLSGQILGTQITDGAITTPKIQANSITSTLIQAGAIIAGKLAVDAVTAGTIATGAIRASDAVFETGAIGTADIGDASITNAKIQNTTIQGGKIAAVTITAANIQDGTITGTKIGNATITGSNIQGGTITGAHIAGGTITGANIQDSTITNAKITGLVADKITAGTITASISITAATISGSTLTLNLNGIITTIANQPNGFGVGISIKSASSNTTAHVNPGALYLVDSTNTMVASLVAQFGGGGILTLVSGSDTISLNPVNAGGLTLSSVNHKVQGPNFLLGNSGFKAVLALGFSFALRCSTNGQKVVAGIASFSSGGVSINTGLSSVTAGVAVAHFNGGAGRGESVCMSTPSGGVVTFLSSNVSSFNQFWYMVFGIE